MKWENYGESSLTLLAVHNRMDKEDPRVPYDAWDFKRCVHLFECLEFGQGEIFSLLCQTANKYPKWKPFAENWDKMMQLYNEEKEKDIFPKLYKLIQEIHSSY